MERTLMLRVEESQEMDHTHLRSRRQPGTPTELLPNCRSSGLIRFILFYTALHYSTVHTILQYSALHSTLHCTTLYYTTL